MTVNIEVKSARQIPLWVWLAAIGGALFLLLIIFLILWKCGCFKRKEEDEDVQFHQVFLKKSSTFKLTINLGDYVKTS